MAGLRKIRITIYEQAEKFARVRAGIQQSPNALRVHRGLGTEAELRGVAFAPATALNREAVSGAVTNDHPLGEAVEKRYGVPYLTLHRGDLHGALAMQAASSANTWVRQATDPHWLYGYDDAWSAPPAAAVEA